MHLLENNRQCVACLLLHRGVDILTLHDERTNSLTLYMVQVKLTHLQDVVAFLLNDDDGFAIAKELSSRQKRKLIDDKKSILKQINDAIHFAEDPIFGAYAYAVIDENKENIKGLAAFDLRHMKRNQDPLTQQILSNNSKSLNMHLFSLEVTDIKPEILDKHVLVNYFKIYSSPDPITRKMTVFFNGLAIRGISSELILLFCDLHFNQE